MSDKEAAKRKIKPMGVFRGFAVAGCEPDEMGIGPIYAIPRLLERTGVKMEDSAYGSSTRRSPARCLYP